jgi:hypothetical protein
MLDKRQTLINYLQVRFKHIKVEQHAVHPPQPPPCVQAPDLTFKCYTNLNKNTLAYFAALLAMKKKNILKLARKSVRRMDKMKKEKENILVLNC